MKTKTKSYDELHREFLVHWDAAAELAKEMNRHPDKTLAPKPAPKAKPAPKKRPVYWPRKLAC